MPLLPGTPGERISDLCNGRHISQKELAKRIGVSAPQLSRIVSGETKTINSDILIAVAKEFKVSTDYILGLSEVSARKSYDIFELGFSDAAAKSLVTSAVDMLFDKIGQRGSRHIDDLVARHDPSRRRILKVDTDQVRQFGKVLMLQQTVEY